MLNTPAFSETKIIRNVFKCIVQICLISVVVCGQSGNEPENSLAIVGKTITRSLKGGESHSYNLTLKEKQFVKVIVLQKGIDVAITFYDSENKKISEIDSPNGTEGEEPISVVAEQAGNYRLEVLSPDKNAPEGTYEIKLTELRTATDTDKIMIAAENAYSAAIVLYSMGTAQSLQAAIPKFERSGQLYRQLGDKQKEAESVGWNANIFSALGDKRKALETYDQALLLFRAAGDKANEANTLNNMGGIFFNLGEYQKSLEKFEQTLTISRAVNDKLSEAKALTNSGLVLSIIGETQKAIDRFNQAIPLFRAINNSRGEALVYSHIGAAYIFLGEKEKALEAFEKALPVFRANNDKTQEAVTLGNIGKAYSDLGETRKALEYFNQALLKSRAAGDRQSEFTALSGIALCFSNLGEKQKALEYYRSVLEHVRSMGDRNSEASTLGSMALVYNDTGEKQKALELCIQSLPLFRFTSNRRGEAITYSYLSSLFTAKSPRLAVFFGKMSINIYQVLRSKMRSLDKNTQLNYLKLTETTYRRLATPLIEQNRLAEAHQILNLFKDQQYFDLNSNEVNPPILSENEKIMAADLDRHVEALVKAIGRSTDYKRAIGTRQPTGEENTELGKIEAELEAASKDLTAFLKLAETKFSGKFDENDKVGEVNDLVVMQSALSDLNAQTGRKTVAIYQVVGEDNFSALLITPKSIEKIELAYKGEQLNEKARQLWALLQTDKYDPTILSNEIYDVVFKPLEAKLPKDTTTIMWSLDGNLRYLPMAALYDGKRYLGERYTHAVFTRADPGRMLAKVSRSWTGTGFGNSQSATVKVLGNNISFNSLPGVTKELSGIFTTGNKGIITGETFSDERFSKANLIDALKYKRPLVHIASHFNFRPGDDAGSFLLLGDKTVLTLEEIKQEQGLFEGVELLTLSACNTAAQQAGANGREIDGFAELAQRLGAGAVMATLWQVSDESTPLLMRNFYSTRQSNTGVTKSEALQRAQIGLLNGTARTKLTGQARKEISSSNVKIVVTPDGKAQGETRGAKIVYIAEKDAPLFKKNNKKPFAHPFYWSPFVLYGNWR